MKEHLTLPSLAVFALCATFAQGAPPAPTPDPDDGGIKLPAGFRALVVADDLGPLRFMTVAANGDVYVKMRQGGIFALRDTDGDGRADVTETFGGGGGTGIALRDGWLYHSSNTGVSRYRMTPGELVPRGQPEAIVVDLPAERQHESKSFAFDEEGRLYVEVGSPSNAYGDPDRARGAKGKDPTEFLKKHGGFWRFSPDRPGQKQADGFHFSTGHRHVLAIARHPVSKTFFFVMHGRDQLNTVAPEHYDEDDNAEKPAEEMHVLREGGNYGWPFTYYDPIQKARMVGPEYGGDDKKRAEPGKYPEPLIAFPAHWAPMQMAIYTGQQFPAKYRGGAFIAFHGSWNRAPRPQKGYNVTFIPFDEKGMPRGTHEVFADGFAGTEPLATPRDARHRPCGLAVGPDGSLYVADSVKGRVWRIMYMGDQKVAERPRPEAPRLEPHSHPRGEELYRQACGICHMADGGGVPGMHPALTGSGVVSGHPGTLIDVTLRGPAQVLPASRTFYPNQMPGFASLGDADVAELLSYVRHEFGRGADEITPAQVAAVRPSSAGARP